MDSYKIVIVDDETLMREGLKTVIDLEDDMDVVGTFENGRVALGPIRKLRPDVVLLDIRMPVMDGMACLKAIKQRFEQMVVVMLTTYSEDDYVVRALNDGADGFLLKDMHYDHLIASLRDAARGQMTIPIELAKNLASRLSQMPEAIFSADDLGIEFTKREYEIALLIVQGRNNRHIAEELYIGEGTVKNYMTGIYRKLGVRDRAEAIVSLKELQMK